VFLHRVGFSFGDKSNNGRYVTPFLQKGMNVVNMRYRIRQGVPVATEERRDERSHVTND